MARLIFLLLFSTLAWSAQSQLTLSAPELVQDPGDEFYIDITTQGFDSIVAIQLAMKWDSSVIKFLTIDSLNLQATNPNQYFSFDYLDNGLLPFVWSHPGADYTDLPDDALIMRLKFKAIGAASSSTTIKFVNTNTANILALAGVDSAPIDVSLDQGEVKLTPVLAVQGVSEMADIQISPNPSSQDLKIQFSLSQSVDLTWSVVDLHGKEILTRSFAKADGQQTILIDRDIFPATGIYLFSLRTAHGLLTRKLIVQ